MDFVPCSGLWVTPERIINELAKLAFSNVQDFLKAGADWTKLTAAQMAAVTEIHVEECQEGGERAASIVRMAKVKLADKRAALVDLGKFLGMDKAPFKQPEPAADDEHEVASSNPELAKVIELFRKRGAR